MTNTQSSLTPTQTRWLQHITAWETSDLSQADYCNQHQLVYGTFIYWRHRLKRLDANSTQHQTVSFLPITLNSVTPKPLVLRVNDRHSIELDTDFDPVLLNRVVQAIGSGP